MAKVAGFELRATKAGVVLNAHPYALNARTMTPTEAIDLADALVRTASRLDPWAEAKFRGIEGLRKIKSGMWRMKTWHKVPGFKKALAAFKKKEGRDVEDWEVFQFFSSKNIDVGPYDFLKCRSPIKALREGDMEACMHAIHVHGEMGG